MNCCDGWVMMSSQFWGEHMSVHVDRRQFLFEIGFPSCLQVIAISYTKIHSYILNVRASENKKPPLSHTHTIFGHQSLVWYKYSTCLPCPHHPIRTSDLWTYTHLCRHTQKLSHMKSRTCLKWKEGLTGSWSLKNPGMHTNANIYFEMRIGLTGSITLNSTFFFYWHRLSFRNVFLVCYMRLSICPSSHCILIGISSLLIQHLVTN